MSPAVVYFLQIYIRVETLQWCVIQWDNTEIICRSQEERPWQHLLPVKTAYRMRIYYCIMGNGGMHSLLLLMSSYLMRVWVWNRGGGTCQWFTVCVWQVQTGPQSAGQRSQNGILHDCAMTQICTPIEKRFLHLDINSSLTPLSCCLSSLSRMCTSKEYPLTFRWSAQSWLDAVALLCCSILSAVFRTLQHN